MFLSCGENLKETRLGYFSTRDFNLDTVFINPSDEILFLKYGLISSGINKERKYFYNFNDHDVTIEKIDLDELKLLNKLPFEREGPNGIGTGMSIMRVINDNLLSISGINQSTLFSMDGKKQTTVYYENFELNPWHMGGDLLKGDKVILDPSSKKLYGLIQGYDNNIFKFIILNWENYETSKLDLKNFEKIPEYSFSYKIDERGKMSPPLNMSIEKFDNKIIMSNEITSSLTWFDTTIDSMYFKSYSHQLTPNQKEKAYKINNETPEEYETEIARFREEINFMSPFWDEENQTFFRFSYSENNDKTVVYLTAYDNKLNIIGETVVPQLIHKPSKHFVKDNKIWIYKNMEDEMAFLRLEIIIKN